MIEGAPDAGRMHVQQLVSTCTMVQGLLRTSLMYVLDGEEAKLAGLLMNNLNERLMEAKEWLHQGDVIPKEIEYVQFVQRMAHEMDWIVLPAVPKVQKVEDGAIVEAYVYVTEAELPSFRGE